jgi:hypothetical protein
MKKLHLRVDELTVHSYATTTEDGERGTVNANLAYTNTLPTCVYHCTYLGPTCEACARDGAA